MSNPPRQKGTRAETAAANWLTNELGITIVRGPLRGNADRGDLFGIDWLCIEIKNTKLPNIGQWGKELAVECRNSGKDAGVVLWSPPGVGMKNVDKWIALEWFGLRVQTPTNLRPVPHIGPLNKLHRFVSQASPWGATVMNARGGCPESIFDAMVLARLADQWILAVGDEVARRSLIP